MTQKDIFELIKLDATPYWSLYAVGSYQRRHVGSFNLEGLSNLSDDEKIQKSIDALEQRLHLLGDEKNFIIKLKKSQKSNQDGLFEYQFVSTIAGGGNSDGLGGLSVQNPLQLGYMPMSLYDKEKELLQSSLSGQLHAMQQENELQLKKIMNEFEVKRKLEQITQKQKDLQELEKKYNSKKDLVSDTLGSIIDNTFEKWFKNGLNGIEEEKEEEDPRAQRIEEFANKLYDSKYSDKELNKILENVENLYKEKNESTEKSLDTARMPKTN